MTMSATSTDNNNNTSDAASLIVADSKAAVPLHLTTCIAALSRQAIAARGAFTVALSGGSLPSFLAALPLAFDEDAGDDPQWDKWRVLLADERCVPESDPDSNLGSLRQHFLSATKIPAVQIYGIEDTQLSKSTTEEVAAEYETKLKIAVAVSGGCLDLAVLGFGPDGHTCSLFPNHVLLQEETRWVAPITDSPKPPPHRITLTFPVLNRYTRHVIICGAGASKGPILEKVLVTPPALIDTDYSIAQGTKYAVKIQRNPPPFPCAMVNPNVDDGMPSTSTLTWIVDADAVQNLQRASPL